MCGRYSLGLRPFEVRAYLEAENMPVNEIPEEDGDIPPRQSYNFAPGYNGLVYRADTPDWGAGPRGQKQGEEEGEGEPFSVDEPSSANEPGHESQKITYKLQSMKWGLIPFWTKRNPDYGSMLKTINCRDDSLIEDRGMWTTMKRRKRCIVVAQGFYEWLKKNNGKEKIPHFTKRKDGRLLCMAGLWDCAQYDGSDEKIYTYTIITTSSNKQLNFLHDRMPVIFDNGSDAIRAWLDPKRHIWTKELQSLLKPYDGELEIYPVSKEVGKVGNNSPTFIVPIDSSKNKNNIANYFNSSRGDKSAAVTVAKKLDNPIDSQDDQAVTRGGTPSKIKHDPLEERKTVDHTGTENNAPLPVTKKEQARGIKREHTDHVPEKEEHFKKLAKKSESPLKSNKISPMKSGRNTRSATSNGTSPAKRITKHREDGNLTSFFGKVKDT